MERYVVVADKSLYRRVGRRTWVPRLDEQVVGLPMQRAAEQEVERGTMSEDEKAKSGMGHVYIPHRPDHSALTPTHRNPFPSSAVDAEEALHRHST